MFRPRCFNCLLCKCAAGSLTLAGLTQRLTTAAVGAAEWRTVLVRGGDRTSSRRAVTISVQLGNGPSSEPGRTLDARNRRLPATLNCLDEACFPPNHSSNFAHLVWLVLSWLGAVHFSIHAKSVYPFIDRSGLASGLPSAPAGVIMLQLALVSPSPIAPLEEPLLTSQQRMEAARDSQVGVKQLGGCTSMLFIHKILDMPARQGSSSRCLHVIAANVEFPVPCPELVGRVHCHPVRLPVQAGQGDKHKANRVP